jgi:hypothetical protein
MAMNTVFLVVPPAAACGLPGVFNAGSVPVRFTCAAPLDDTYLWNTL